MDEVLTVSVQLVKNGSEDQACLIHFGLEIGLKLVVKDLFNLVLDVLVNALLADRY